MTAPRTRAHRVNLFLSDQEVDWLKALGELHGLDVSNTVRKLIRDAVKEEMANE